LARHADIVHTQGWEIPQIGLPAVACLRVTGRPVVHTEHGTFDRTTSFPRTRRLVRRLTGRLTARTVVHTQADLASMRPVLGARAVVIPHGEYGGLARSGGEAKREQARAALGIPEGAPVTLMFGQLRPDKGLSDLVEAVARVPSLHLLIGGKDTGGLAAVRERLDVLAGRESQQLDHGNEPGRSRRGGGDPAVRLLTRSSLNDGRRTQQSKKREQGLRRKRHVRLAQDN